MSTYETTTASPREHAQSGAPGPSLLAVEKRCPVCLGEVDCDLCESTGRLVFYYAPEATTEDCEVTQ